MKRMMIALAVAGMIFGASGCGCCRGLIPQTVVAAPAPPPVAYPAAYDPCATPGVTYGTAPMGTYAPANYAPAPTW
jgi:hypothetical protein